MAMRMRLRVSGGDTRSHMGFGNHAKHRAAVEAERSVRDKPEFQGRRASSVVPYVVSRNTRALQQFVHGRVRVLFPASYFASQ